MPKKGIAFANPFFCEKDLVIKMRIKALLQELLF